MSLAKRDLTLVVPLVAPLGVRAAANTGRWQAKLMVAAAAVVLTRSRPMVPPEQAALFT